MIPVLAVGITTHPILHQVQRSLTALTTQPTSDITTVTVRQHGAHTHHKITTPEQALLQFRSA
jgi:hypothetical protein